jgi:hypothetical protein
MAKDKEKEVIDKILTTPSTNDFISRLVHDQSESFPSVSEISIDEPYVDPFEPPKWCDQKNFAFAWIDPKDDIQRHRTLDAGYFKIVTRMSSCIIHNKVVERDFRDHGAVERQGMILIYRPKDLDDRLRTYPVKAHADMLATLKAGKQETGFEVTHLKYKDGDHSADAAEDKRGGSFTPVVAEDAGEEGLKPVGG